MRTGITPAEALEIVLEHTRPLGPETLPAPDALGRVAAEAVVATRRLPPFDNAAMDGYALRAADARGAGPDRPALLPLAFEVAAGDAALRELPAGSAARIFTGAPLPPGADAIVRQEDAEARAGAVAIRVAPAAGDHVRRAGEDVSAGEVVLEAGCRLGPAQLGVLASLGKSLVRVHRRPRVAILSGGDELVEPDEDVSGGRIVASNAYLLAAQCAEAGATTLNPSCAGWTGGSTSSPRSRW